MLAHAPGLDAEWADVAKAQGGDLPLLEAAQHGLFRLGIRAQKDELILGQGNRLPLPRAVHGIERLRRRPLFLEGREQIIGNVDLRPAGIGLGAVRQPVGGEVLRWHPHHLGPDAGDHVPAHQRHRRPLVHEAPAHLQHPSRPATGLYPLGEGRVHMVDLQAHGASTGQGHAFYQVAPEPQVLQEAEGLPALFPASPSAPFRASSSSSTARGSTMWLSSKDSRA